MDTPLKYMPVLRLKQEEKKVLTSFDFGTRIYPCVEIIKAFSIKPRTTFKGRAVDPKPAKPFEQVYLPIIESIQSKKVFVDLPIHLASSKNASAEVLSFFRTVVANRAQRTKYLIKLAPLNSQVIPVISTYHQLTGESNSIKKQEADLRSYFHTIAFRTFEKTFKNDMIQIAAIAKKTDFLIVDLNDTIANVEDDDLVDIVDSLEKFNNCPVILLRSALSSNLTNTGLDHCKKIVDANNDHLETYSQFHAQAFGDYAGIKKGDLKEGGRVSPGFIYFDPINNEYVGFKGRLGEYDDFEDIIVPAVLNCYATKAMKRSGYPFLTNDNGGWKILEDIDAGTEPPKSMAKFKSISMLHYLHCVKIMIEAGDFD